MIWEVFRQEREGQPFQHGGSVEAPNREFAEAYAKEFYGRRAESVALWIVPREAVLEVPEPYVADVFDRDYRRVDGYSLKVKLREARERAGTA
jgi:phenylacetate-CoA oxygenase PaaH subunit